MLKVSKDGQNSFAQKSRFRAVSLCFVGHGREEHWIVLAFVADMQPRHDIHNSMSSPFGDFKSFVSLTLYDYQSNWLKLGLFIPA